VAPIMHQPPAMQKLLTDMQEELLKSSDCKVEKIAAINGSRCVFKCTKPGTKSQKGELLAVKAIRRDCNFPQVVEKKVASDQRAAEMEIRVLQQLSHGAAPGAAGSENVVPILDSFYTKSFLFIVTPWVAGGDLFQHLHKTSCHDYAGETELDTMGRWFAQICRAVSYVHTSGHAHRDISPENILISNGTAKLHDFGLACPASKQTTKVGKILYAAPEIFRSVPYDPKAADVWSLSIVLFSMLSKHVPMNSAKPRDENFQYFCHDPASFMAQILRELGLENTMSDQAQDLFLKMAKVRPEERLTIEEVLQHPFILQYQHNDDEINASNCQPIKGKPKRTRMPRSLSIPARFLKEGVMLIKGSTSRLFREILKEGRASAAQNPTPSPTSAK